LFRAKNGGYAVQGGVKNYLGEQEMVHAPKHWQSAPDHPETELTYITKPEKDLLVKADLHGSLHGSINKGPQGLTSLNGWGDADDGFGGNEDKGAQGSDEGWSPGVSHSGSPPDKAPDEGGHSRFDVGSGYYGEPVTGTTENISGGDIWDWDDTSEVDDVIETYNNVKDRYDRNKTKQNWKMLVSVLSGDIFGAVKNAYGMNKDKKAYEEMLGKLKADALELGIPTHTPHTDTLIQTINKN